MALSEREKDRRYGPKVFKTPEARWSYIMRHCSGTDQKPPPGLRALPSKGERWAQVLKKALASPKVRRSEFEDRRALVEQQAKAGDGLAAYVAKVAKLLDVRLEEEG